MENNETKALSVNEIIMNLKTSNKNEPSANPNNYFVFGEKEISITLNEYRSLVEDLAYTNAAKKNITRDQYVNLDKLEKYHNIEKLIRKTVRHIEEKKCISPDDMVIIDAYKLIIDMFDMDEDEFREYYLKTIDELKK